MLWGHSTYSARIVASQAKRLVRLVQACAFVLLTLGSAAAHADAFVLTDDALSGHALGRYVDVLEDETGSLSLRDVRQAPYAQRFKRSTASALGFGLTKSA